MQDLIQDTSLGPQSGVEGPASDDDGFVIRGNRQEGVGFQNGGNQCYFASVIQCLTNIEEFSSAIIEVVGEVEQVQDDNGFFPFIYYLAQIIRKKVQGAKGFFKFHHDGSPLLNIKTKIRNTDPTNEYGGIGVEEDAPDFLLYLLKRICVYVHDKQKHTDVINFRLLDESGEVDAIHPQFNDKSLLDIQNALSASSGDVERARDYLNGMMYLPDPRSIESLEFALPLKNHIKVRINEGDKYEQWPTVAHQFPVKREMDLESVCKFTLNTTRTCEGLSDIITTSENYNVLPVKFDSELLERIRTQRVPDYESLSVNLLLITDTSLHR